MHAGERDALVVGGLDLRCDARYDEKEAGAAVRWEVSQWAWTFVSAFVGREACVPLVECCSCCVAHFPLRSGVGEGDVGEGDTGEGGAGEEVVAKGM